MICKRFTNAKYGDWRLEVCQPIRLRDIGDLALLKRDYNALGETIQGRITWEIDQKADFPLSSFFGKWDIEYPPLWLTGLLLGYPVENTISLYMEQLA